MATAADDGSCPPINGIGGGPARRSEPELDLESRVEPYPPFRVREPLDVKRVGRPEERDRLVCASVGDARLRTDDDFLNRKTHELSGGQLQRVALARVLVLQPKLLVPSEPVSMLDPSEQAKVLQLFKHLQVERGMGIIFVSHDLATVLRVADRVLVLERGQVVEEGAGETLLVAPQHPVTRSLLAAAGRRRPVGTATSEAAGLL